MAPCGRVTVPEESPGEIIGEGTAQLQRLHHFGDVSSVGWPPKNTTATVKGASLGVGDRLWVLQRAELEKWHRPFGAQRIMGESQTSSTELCYS